LSPRGRSQEAQPRERLRVSMPGDYARQHFSRAIATIIEACPEIQLDLDLTSRRVDLIGERFDLAIRMGALENDSTLCTPTHGAPGLRSRKCLTGKWRTARRRRIAV